MLAEKQGTTVPVMVGHRNVLCGRHRAKPCAL
jgi:hypothetical protein